MIGYIASILIVPGFWLGWKFLPGLIAWLEHIPNHPIQLSTPQKTILWLAVGGLFTNTLNFLFQFLYSLVTMLIIPGWCYSQPGLMTRFGRISSCFQIIPAILVLLLIFAFVLKYFHPLIAKQTKKLNKTFAVILLLTIVNFIYGIYQILSSLLISSG